MKLLHDKGMSRTENRDPQNEASRISMKANDATCVFFDPLRLIGALDITSRMEIPVTLNSYLI